MKITLRTLLLSAAFPLLASCHHVEEWDGGMQGNFDALWTIVDEHYCFFDEKGIDWQETGKRYRARINPEEMKATDFFNLCGQMLNELCDGHVNLSSSFNTSYYRRWWSDYPQNFDERLIQQYYLEFDYAQAGPLSYKVLHDSIGYMRVSTMSGGIPEGALDVSLMSFADAGCNSIVIDVRDNGGGMMTTAERLVSRFFDGRILAGYISHKTGPGHNDFSEPYPFHYDTASGHVRWLRPVVLLTNRSTFSAANNFVSIMRLLPNVRIAGDTTGGGSGMPYSSELPCGWAVRMSACPVYDAEMRLTEHGVPPSDGCRIDLDPQLALQGTDTMLEFALDLAADWREWIEKEIKQHKMKRILIAAVAAACSTGIHAQENTDSVEGFVFTDEISIPVTSVKDQNKSGTCWCFSGTSFFENEIRKAGGDSLDLSEMFTVRHCYADKADRYVRMYGGTHFAAGGSILDVPYVWERYGAVPEEVYSGLNYGEDKHVHEELDGVLKAYLDVIIKKPNSKLSTAWRKGIEGILDAYLGELPETFNYNGKEYTPQSYAASLGIDPEDYVALTSFTHHPFYEAFVFEVPDNWLWAQYTNVPLNELKAVVDNALSSGHTVAWAADVSEGGFKWTDGVALLPKGKDEGDMSGTELSRWVKLSDKDRVNEKYNFTGPVEEIEVTQELRQEYFDRQETTDDHGMEIVGTAHDQKGNRYYKVKNSWDTNQKYNGYIYVSEPFFLGKTLNILVNKKAVPAAIAKKIGLK